MSKDAKEIVDIKKRMARCLSRATSISAAEVVLFDFDRALELAHDVGRRTGLNTAIDRLVKQQDIGSEVDVQMEIVALHEHLFEPSVAVDALEIPDLVYVLDYMLGANDLCRKPRREWPVDIGFDYVRLNSQASRLTKDEKGIVADGEEGEANKITAKHKCHQLSAFLAEVFDGHLTDLFCVPVTGGNHA